MAEQYWFYIDAYVHVSIKKDTLLLYNPYTGGILERLGNPDLVKLVKRLKAPQNLQVILLSESDLENAALRKFVDKIRDNFMGDLIDVAYSEGKPIQLTPMVKVQRDVKYLKWESQRSVGKNVMEYLSGLTLYVNDRCNQGCNICNNAYLQFRCCTAKNKKNRQLDIEALGNFFEEIQDCHLDNINILGGDIFSHTRWQEMLALIKTIPAKKIYYLHYLNAADHQQKLNALTGNNDEFRIIVDFPINDKKLRIAVESIAVAISNPRYIFVIKSETDLKSAESLISSYTIDNHDFKAFYTGDNLDFFEENLYIEREDIQAEKPSLKDIYTKESVNPVDFGYLSILPNGRIYANINNPGLGTLGKDSIYNILMKEMNDGKSWRKIRKNVLPCKRCTFEKLCPPITDYNMFIRKNDLCHILPTLKIENK